MVKLFHKHFEINDVFLGTYVLMEKIKRDKNRVAISKNKEEDNTSPVNKGAK